jgi:hypothetical protein
MAVQEMRLSNLDSVAAEHPSFSKMKPAMELVGTLLGGTEAIRSAGKAYLPQYDAELSENYAKRLAKSTLLPAFSDTLDYLVGKVFQRPITLDRDDTPESIRLVADNVDRAKNSLNVFANWVFRDMIANGLTHILVDMAPIPRNEDGTPAVYNKAEAEAKGRLPYWVHVKADQVRAWQSDVVDGEQVLTQARIWEQVEVPVGEFGVDIVEQIRVLEIGRYRIFRLEGGAWVEHPELGGSMDGPDGQPFPYIPLITIYAMEPKGVLCAEPPLVDLGYKNVEHYQVHSDYLNCLTMACFPILAVSGYKAEEDGKITVGPTTLMQFSSADARAYYVEHSGKALGSARQHLEDLKQEMATSGLQLLMPKTGATPTATGEAIDAAKSTSELQSMAERLKDGLERALDCMADWMGEPHGSQVLVNTDLTLTLGKMDIDQLIKAMVAKLIPMEVGWKEMIRRGFLKDQDLKELKDMLESDAASVGELAALAGSLLKPQTGVPAGSRGSSPDLPGAGEPGTGNPPIGT